MSKRTTPSGLTRQQEDFATGVASGLSLAAAYRAAYPRAAKWADPAVWAAASALAGTDKVSVRVQALLEQAAQANEVTVERIVAELAKIAFGDARRVMTWGPSGVRLLDSGAIEDDAAAIVAEVSETTSATGGSLKLKTHDKLAALRLLADIKGAVVSRSEVTGKGGKDLVPEQPKGVLVVPGVLDDAAWEAMLACRPGGEP